MSAVADVVEKVPDLDGGKRKKCPEGFVRDRRVGAPGEHPCRAKHSRRKYSKPCPRGSRKENRKKKLEMGQVCRRTVESPKRPYKGSRKMRARLEEDERLLRENPYRYYGENPMFSKTVWRESKRRPTNVEKLVEEMERMSMSPRRSGRARRAPVRLIEMGGAKSCSA